MGAVSVFSFNIQTHRYVLTPPNALKNSLIYFSHFLNQHILMVAFP